MDNNEYYETIGKLLNGKYTHKALNDLVRAVSKHIEKMECELAELKAEKRIVKNFLKMKQTASQKLEAIEALLED